MTIPKIENLNIGKSGKSRIEEVAERKVEAPKAPRSSAYGVRTEAPRGVGCGEWISPSPLGRGLGRGCAPSPEIFFRFGAQNGEFWYILGVILKNAANSVSMALAC